ncbi:MAG: tetratricopeptide repeat protein [Thermodesulfobacteriota bacterium]|nr:tetratricopeptide repeat protein [Thermodesulfobacteriota bacterium]
METKSPDDGMTKFEKVPFSVLVKEDRDLATLRREYASKPAGERRKAADWEYHSEMAGTMFNDALARAGQEGFGKSFWPSGVVALAIDPMYAPAILTVGSIEYQIGRVEEAMRLFITLTMLPKDEEDLVIIIDKAGDFLLDQDDYENALALYSAAEKAYPRETVYLNGSGYCLGKFGRYEDSVKKHRRVDALEPNNYKHLNDLGYSLFEAGKFDEAEEVLQRSISLAPSDYEFPRNNLSELREKRNRQMATS